MLTVRHARPEMRSPIRTWMRANARTLAALGVGAVVLILVALAGSARCGIEPDGQWDCPLAGEGLLVLLALGSSL